jgi:dolichyl-phosphate mannosyltransferase polypeptide 2 regulatory subunit
VYYTFWVLITPFIDADQPIHQWFPHRQYALTIPLVMFLLLLTVVGIFLGLVMINSKVPEKKKVD